MSVETINFYAIGYNGRNCTVNMKYDKINASVAYNFDINSGYGPNFYQQGGIINKVCNRTMNIIKFVSRYFTINGYAGGLAPEFIDLINYINTLKDDDFALIESEKKRLELDNQLKDTQLKELTQKLKEQDDKLIELTQKLNEKDLKIKDLEDDLIYFTSSKKKDDIITNLESSNQLKDMQLKELTKKLEEKDSELEIINEDLEAKIEDLEGWYSDDDEPKQEIVKKIEYDGKTYLKSKKTGIVYDYQKYVNEEECVKIGRWNEKIKKIIFRLMK